MNLLISGPYIALLMIVLIMESLCLYNIKKQRRSVRVNTVTRISYLRVTYFIMLVFIGLRGFVYTDFMNYYPFFNHLDISDYIDVSALGNMYEPGFVLYSYICKLLFDNYFVWNFISAVIDLSLLYVFIKRYSPYHLLSVAIFIVMGFTALEFNVLRNAKAIFIFLLGLKYLESRNLKKYSLYILVAMTFHLSAIFYWPLYFILHKRWNRSLLLTIFIVGLIVCLTNNLFFVNFILDNVLVGFSDQEIKMFSNAFVDDGSRISIGLLERVITFLLMLYFYDKRISRNHCKQYVFSNMFVLFYMVWMFFSSMPTLLQRMNYLFIPCYWILYPQWIAYARRKRGVCLIKARFLKTGLVLFLVLKTVVGTDPTLKYENLLTGISTYNQRVVYTYNCWDE